MSQRIFRHLLVEVPYINYRYVEARSTLEKISERPVTGLSGLTGTGRQKSRPAASLQ